MSEYKKFSSELHLDLGCGNNPRNPYNAKNLYGIDIINDRDFSDEKSINYVQSNLFTKKIPFKDNFFNSISAFDFLEHVPRIRIYDDDTNDFPFINLMNEIYRILNDKGRFYAVTPVFPNKSVFVDPTHVNVLTTETHTYFCGKSPTAKMYGFKGNFSCLQSKLVSHKYINFKANNIKVWDRFKDMRKRLKGDLSHIVWELEAIK